MAENVKKAEELIRWYRSTIGTQATWSVAENFRYLNSFGYAREKVQELGRALGFRVRIYANIKEGAKYYGESNLYYID